MKTSNQLQKKIVVVGGGAGGLELVTHLGKKLGKSGSASITLVDRAGHHIWKPLLHEIAAGSLDDNIDSVNYLAHAKNNYYHFQLGTLINIDRHTKQITLAEIHNEQNELMLPERSLDYDILVMALGSISNDFGTPGVKEHCLFLDSQEQAVSFHKKLLEMLFKKSHDLTCETDFNVVIVGGGATGVELSAELHHAIAQLSKYEYEGLNHQCLKLTLIEASDRLLKALPAKIADTVTKKLTEIGVKVLVDTQVVKVEPNKLHTKSGEVITGDMIVWAAGIKAPDFLHNIGGLETNRINQLVVNKTLQSTLDPDIFAIGDCASCPQDGGSFVPPRAQSAHQMAWLCYQNILAMLHGKLLKDYLYKDHGSLVSLSKFGTVGCLMNNSLIVKGCVARCIYVSLYRMHQMAVQGCIKTVLAMLSGSINRIIRPKLKLH